MIPGETAASQKLIATLYSTAAAAAAAARSAADDSDAVDAVIRLSFATRRC